MPCIDGSTPTFSDVSASHVFCTPIEWAAADGVTGGYPDDTFRPTTMVTRGQMVELLYRFAGVDDFAAPTDPTFSDAPPTHLFFEAIEWAAASGLVGGYVDGTFRPADIVTRAHAAAILHRFAAPQDFSAPEFPTFTDVPVTHLFSVPIEWAAAVGIARGTSTSTFSPTGALRRQTLAALLFNLHALEVVSAAAPDRLAAGGRHTCALRDDAGVRCWGDNAAGQLGDGTTDDRFIAGPVPGLPDVREVSAGEAHTCAALLDGTARCWGANDHGQLGDGTTNASATPVHVVLPAAATAIGAGSGHSCALLIDRTVACWGANGQGQLGDGTTNSRAVPERIPGLVAAVDVAVGTDHSCAVIADGTARCWGNNALGQLGDSTSDNRRRSPVVVHSVGFVAIDTGTNRTCALHHDASASCWGVYDVGTSVGTYFMPIFTSTPTTRAAEVADVDVGGDHHCTVLLDRTVHCRGDAMYGQIGLPFGAAWDTAAIGDDWIFVYNESAVPAGVADVVEIAAGAQHSCALRSDGSVTCWGRRDALGDGIGSRASAPVSPVGLDLDVVASDGGNCAVLTDGTARCWGQNWSEGLDILDDVNGSLQVVPFAPTPLPVHDLSNVGPTGPEPLAAITQLSSSHSHWCAVLNGGVVLCNDALQREASPSVGDAVAVDSGGEKSCVLRAGGTLRCIGRGWLGDGTHYDTPTSVPVAGLSEVTEVSAGQVDHACATRADGTVWCWGDNWRGQLGNGTTAAADMPTQVVELPGSTSVSAGYEHTCAVSAAGTVWC